LGINTLQGFLNLHKAAGFTSHDCVAKVRRLLRLKRVGHAGTLDPAATGVLPIALGKATRLLQFLRQDKAYRATIRLGLSTTTDDLEGETLRAQPVPHLSLDAVTAALQAFQGKIQQVPPNFSAIQVQGKRLYDMARAGQAIAVPPRAVEVFSLDVLGWRPGDFPELDLAIACGPGTYIRSIARDLGQSLDTGGTLAALIRTASSGFELVDSLTLEDLEAQIEAGTFQLTHPETALHHLVPITLPPDIARRWCQGQKILIDQIDQGDWAIGDQSLLHVEALPERKMPIESPNLRVYHAAGHFLGIGQPSPIPNGVILLPRVVFDS